MKNFKHILMALFISGLFTGCFLDDDNTFHTPAQNDVNVTEQNNNNDNSNNNTDTNEDNTAATQFSIDVQSVLNQNEDDEPLEISDTVDETSSFNTLL